MTTKSKEQLLDELEELGYTRTGRKRRSDIGKSRDYTPSSKPRADKGRKREIYNKTAAHYRRVFTTFITAHTTETGDNLSRDANDIFAPQVTHYFKEVAGRNDSSYRSSVKRANHPEELRWRWWMQEYREADEASQPVWTLRLCNHYFIKPEDIMDWTYREWAWAYYNEISGHPNRFVSNPKIISYDDYLSSSYGYPPLDNEGEIVWPKH